VGVADNIYNAWNYRPSAGFRPGTDLIGYKIAAVDGDIGRVDQAIYGVDAAFLVVETGRWMTGRKVMLPAGVIERINPDEQKVYTDRTKAQIEDAPEYDADADIDVGCRDRLGGYYGDTYRTGL
jgi:hypothetical protein